MTITLNATKVTKPLLLWLCSISAPILWAGAGGGLFTSCHRDIVQVDRNNESSSYSNGWEKRFGRTDAEQTWNMATQLTPDKALSETYEWIIAAEDLANYEDYDFNDAVFKISHEAGERRITVTPLAAGGTYPTRLYFNGQLIGEIHQMIDPAQTAAGGLYTPLNVGSKGNPGQPRTINLTNGFSLSNMGSFAIQVSKLQENGTVKILTMLSPAKGKATQMLLLPPTWVWPAEGQSIEAAYPDFVNWNQHAAEYATWTETNVNAEYLVTAPAK